MFTMRSAVNWHRHPNMEEWFPYMSTDLRFNSYRKAHSGHHSMSRKSLSKQSLLVAIGMYHDNPIHETVVENSKMK